MNMNNYLNANIRLNHIVECPLCYTKDSIDFESENREKFNFKAVQCTNCKLVYIDTVIDLEDLNKFYNKYNYNRNILNSDLDEKRKKMYKIDKIYTENFIKNDSRVKILDIGGGSGDFLSHFSSNFKKNVLEIDIAAIDKGVSIYNDIKFYNNFSQIKNEETFDVIIFRGTLQYMPNLNQISDFCYNHLSENGKIILLSIPNIDCILAKIQRQHWNLFNRMEHRYNFGIEQVKLLFKKFKLLNVDYPYYNTPYENYQNDLMNLENIYLNKPGSIEQKFPFFGSMMNLVFIKSI